MLFILKFFSFSVLSPMEGILPYIFGVEYPSFSLGFIQLSAGYLAIPAIS
jgi:hypothetical protein